MVAKWPDGFNSENKLKFGKQIENNQPNMHWSSWCISVPGVNRHTISCDTIVTDEKRLAIVLWIEKWTQRAILTCLSINNYSIKRICETNYIAFDQQITWYWTIARWDYFWYTWQFHFDAIDLICCNSMIFCKWISCNGVTFIVHFIQSRQPYGSHHFNNSFQC